MKRAILVSFMVGSLLTLFQNCGSAVEFSNKSGSVDQKSSSASLVPLALDQNEQDMAEATGSVTQPNDPVYNDDKKKDPPANAMSSDDSEESEDSDDDASYDSNDLVACILVDHGKSLKLGLIEQKLDGVNAVAQSVCISRKGCLEKVSKKFPVQGAYDRGYCAHNPNVVRLSDAELDELLK